MSKITEQTGYWAVGYAFQHDWLAASGWTTDPNQAVRVVQRHTPAQESTGAFAAEEFTYDPPKPASELGDVWFVRGLPTKTPDVDILRDLPAQDWGDTYISGDLYSQSHARQLTLQGEMQAAAVRS